jgi:hypothetical protein
LNKGCLCGTILLNTLLHEIGSTGSNYYTLIFPMNEYRTGTPSNYTENVSSKQITKIIFVLLGSRVEYVWTKMCFANVGWVTLLHMLKWTTDCFFVQEDKQIRNKKSSRTRSDMFSYSLLKSIKTNVQILKAKALSTCIGLDQLM